MDGDDPDVTGGNAEPIQNQTSTPSLVDDDDYTLAYREHLVQTRAHLLGTLPFIDGDMGGGCIYLPPNAYWTTAEKDLFFHALTVHSRLRPDLIAASVRTKTLADVCVLLDALEQGASKHPLSDTSTYSRREKYPIAYEVSDVWVDKEEELAARLTGTQDAWEARAITQLRKEETSTRRIAARVPKPVTQEERTTRTTAFEEWLEESQQQWAVEDLFARLRAEDLQAIDRVLRADEESTARTDEKGKDDNEGFPFEDGQLVPAVNPENAMIDPALLAIDSGSVTPALEQSSSSSAFVSTPPDRPSLPQPIVDQPKLPVDFSSTFTIPLFGALSRTQSPALSTGGSTSADADAQLAALSPGSRRRYQKRLYMRHKRAQKRGEAAPREDMGRLKPGRKSITDDISAPKLKKNAEESGEEEDTRVGEKRKRRKGGTSGSHREYKFARQMQELGVDAGALRDAGFGLFHLTTLGKLMKLYKSLHNMPNDASQYISGRTIALLATHVVTYVTEVAHHALVAREQERTLKAHKKVWRMNKESMLISAMDVGRAVQTMGAMHPNRATQFATLLARLGIDHEDEVRVAENTHEDVEIENHHHKNAHLLPSFSLHRSIHAPAIRLSHLTDTARPPLVGLLIPIVEEPPEEELLPLEIDEDALRVELEEEAELDTQDVAVEGEIEDALWEDIAGDEVSEDDEETGSNVPVNKIKSKEYIEDSD